MKIEITEENKEPLLSRVRIKGVVDFSGPTPKKEEVTGKIAESKKVDSDLIVMKSIHNIYGLQKAKFNALIYDTNDALKKIEKERKKKDGKQE